MEQRRRSPFGYALPIVMMVLALLALGFSMLMFVMTASISESRRVAGQIRSFYACDSAIRLASAVTQNIVLANPTKSADAVTVLALNAICTTAGGCAGAVQNCPQCEYQSPSPGVAAGPDAFMPPTANMEYFAVRVFPMVSTRPVHDGAFRDLNALQSLVALSTQGIDNATGTVTRAKETFSVASVSPFQLMAFSTTPLRWRPFRSRPAPAASANLPRIGPAVYAGDSLILGGGGAGIELVRAVSVGSMSGSGPVRIWDGNVGAPTFALLGGPDGRRANVITNKLRLTAAPLSWPAQPAAEQETSARWLLDPPILGEGQPVRDAKLASQADIRILDGVWFLKPPVGSLVPDWPGIPIWSDHAGVDVFPATAEETALMSPSGVPPRIGQADLDTTLGWTSRPRRFSYYESTIGGALIEGAPGSGPKEGVGVVSYGTLAFQGGRLLPGVFSSGGPAGRPPVQPPGPCQNAGVGFSRLVPYDQCNPSSPVGVDVGLLEASRGGFRDVNAQIAGQPANVLPLNFDVDEFLTALTDGSRGELGSYFCGATLNVNNPVDIPSAADGSPLCRPFNGIVYIAATWKGSLDGVMVAGTPTRAPVQGSTVVLPVGNLQPVPTFQNSRTWLPRQLCTSQALENPATPVPLEGAGPVRFPAVGCSDVNGSNFDRIYVRATGAQAQVNALRIINGRDLSRIVDDAVAERFGISGGLTIATNLPAYVYGDFNAISGAPFSTGVACPLTGALPAECRFVRSWVAGDRLTFLSRVGGCSAASPGFNDSCVRWSDNLGGGPNTAAQTFYFGGFSSSLSPSIANENVESLFRVVERWGPGSTATSRPAMNVVGAMFGMGRSYYQKEPQAVSGYVPEPQLDWRYLSALSAQDQAPGVPRFVVGVTSRWRDLR